MHFFRSLIPLLLAGYITPLYAEDQRQHDAHEHGVGTLNIALEANELIIMLESPAMNIVGFEHAPRTEDEHAVVDKAMQRLEDGTRMFQIPDAASCRLESAEVHTPIMDGDKHEDEHHDAHHDDEDHGDHHDEDDHGDHHDEDDHGDETHSDVTAIWQFSCARPARLTNIRVRLFEHFSLTERLQVQFVTESGQGAVQLEASQPVLRF